MQNGISVVIPNYNGVQLFPHTLPTVFTALSTIQLPYEVLVVDDCSPDESVAFLQKEFPEVRVISNKKNSGFVITANKGMRNAKYDLALLLNSDVKLEPYYFESQLKYFERDDTFGVMGKIIGWDDNIIQDGAKYPSFHGVKIKTSGNYILGNEDEMKEGLYTMYLSGANALFDRRKFLKLDGFNEMFSPFYVEDYELSLRAWRYGYKCYFNYQSVCRHQVSATIQTKNKKHFIRQIYNRNKFYLHAIHLGKNQRMLWIVQIAPEIIFQTILLKTYYVKAFLHFLKNYKNVRQKRNEFLKMAGPERLSVKQVTSFIQLCVKGKKLKFF